MLTRDLSLRVEEVRDLLVAEAKSAKTADMFQSAGELELAADQRAYAASCRASAEEMFSVYPGLKAAAQFTYPEVF